MKSKPSTEGPSAGDSPAEKPLLIKIWEAYRDDNWESLRNCVAQPENQGSLSEDGMLSLKGMTNKGPNQHECMVELSRRLGSERYREVGTDRMTIARIVYRNDQQAFKVIWPEEGENTSKEKTAAMDR